MKKLIWIDLLLIMTLIAVPIFSASAQDALPPPLDPQSWKLQEDMLWNELKPNPVIDWSTELNPASLVNPMGRGAEPIKGALVLVDFWDRPFIATQELNSDLLGYYLYDQFGQFEKNMTKNPVIHVNANDYATWIRDYLNKNQQINHYHSIDEFWRENSYGKWAVDLESFGPYHLPGFEFEFDLSYTNWSDLPPVFRRATSGSSNYRNMMNEGIACALDDGIYLGDYDFFFILHSGYDESSVWLEFGQMQWATPQEVPYEYGPGAKMEEVEEILTKNPEFLLELETTMTSFNSTTPVINGYTQSFLRDKVAEVKSRKAAGTLAEFEFKFPAADWAWQTTYSYGNAGPTRYVPWSSWIATVSRWSSSGSSTVPRSPANGGGSRSIRQSGQGESDGMGVFAHEFGHITGLSDNYEATMWTQNVSPKTEYWDLMSRGDKVGPGGYHSRWMVPSGREAGSSPAHYMMFSKQRAAYYDAGDLLELSVAQLKTGTPVVAEIVARNIPMNNGGLYPQLEDYGLISPNFYKAINLTFDTANPDVTPLVTTGYSLSRWRAGRTAIEVVDRSGYDSFAADHGVLISRIQSGSTDTHRWVVDSHLYNINLIDYYLNGVPTYYCIGHSDQLNDALFHAGKSFVDTGYYKGDYIVNSDGTSQLGSGTKHSSARQWEERNGRDIISGDTVNEWHDTYNKMHFYILAKNYHEGKYGEFLSYTVGMLHDDGAAVGGDLTVNLNNIERETPLKVAVAYFDITNTGSATDIIRVNASGYLEGLLLNDLYAIEAGQNITVPLYIELPGDIRTKNLSGQTITLTASSESNGNKIGAATVSVSELIAYNYQVYLQPDQQGVFAGETVNVDLLLTGDLNYSQISTEIAYDVNMLKYEGYTNLQGIVAAVSPLNGKVSIRSIPSLNVVFGESCTAEQKIVTLKFTALGNFSGDKTETALSFASVVVNPPAGFIGAGTAPGKDLPLTVYENDYVKSFYTNLALYPEWIGLDAQGLPTTMPIFNYNASSYIDEIVYVEVPCDTDRDGKRDRITLWIRRPVTKAGFRCPVVMEFSPYHAGTRGYSRMSSYINSTDDHLRGLAETFRYKDVYPLTFGVNPDTTNLTYEDVKYTGTEAWDPIWWQEKGAFTVDSWYTGVVPGQVPAATVISGEGPAGSVGAWRNGTSAVSPPARHQHYYTRGYAMVYGQLLGNRDTEGITNTLHMEEWLSAEAAVKWFKGEATAYTTRNGSIETKADWANGLVAMDGTSYPGTTPIVTAMTGVENLKAIMPEANFISLYEYYRSGGAIHNPDGYGGEDMNLHSSFNFSRIDADVSGNNVIPPALGPNFDLTAQKAYVLAHQYMTEKQDRVSGDYNAEWDSRNLTRGFFQIRPDVGILQTCAQHDWNVMSRHAYEMLQGMRDKFSGTHKLVSGLTNHSSQSSRLVPGKDGVERGMLKWYLMFLDHFLLGLDNNIDELMYDIYIANNITGAMEGYDYDPAVEERGVIIPGMHYEKVYLTGGPAGKAGRLSYTAPTAAVEHFADMDIHAQLTAPLHVGVSESNRPSNIIAQSSDGNNRPTSAQYSWAEDRFLGVNRTTTAYGDNLTLMDLIDKPVNGRLLYISEPLSERVQISGSVIAHLRLASDKPFGNLSVAIMELGRKARTTSNRAGSTSPATTGSTTVFPAFGGVSASTATRYANPVGTTQCNFKWVTWGHTDVQNPSYDGKAWFEVPETNYVPSYYYQTTQIVPGQYYDYVVELNPYTYTFEAGQQIAIMVYGTDPNFSPLLTPACTPAFDIQLGAGSYIRIPLSKAVTLEAAADTAPLIEDVIEDVIEEEIVFEVIE